MGLSSAGSSPRFCPEVEFQSLVSDDDFALRGGWVLTTIVLFSKPQDFQNLLIAGGRIVMKKNKSFHPGPGGHI
jgi:hypothetical protein